MPQKSTKKILITGTSLLLITGAILAYLFWPILSARISWFLHGPKSNEITAEGHLPNIDSVDPEALKGNRVLIPKIGIEAPVIEISSPEDKYFAEALADGVVRYPNTSKPGEGSNAFITGHSSNYRWAKGDYNYVFSLLEKLEAGDEITVYYDREKYVYRVSEKKIVKPEDVSVLDPTEKPILSLMSCWPVGTALKRLVVISDQIEPAVTESR